MADELDDKPFDREILTRFAEELRDRGRVVDIGCGPGQIAGFLASHGVDASGIDLSPGMIEQARALHPSLRFGVCDMRATGLEDESLAGITAFYSIIHIPRDEVVSVLAEFRRVLRPDGRLLVAFHLGRKVDHLGEWWGREVSIDFVFFEREEMESNLRSAGFAIQDAREREPYPDVEAQTRRGYLLAVPALAVPAPATRV